MMSQSLDYKNKRSPHSLDLDSLYSLKKGKDTSFRIVGIPTSHMFK